MGPFSLRSLLLAAFVISNCITWTSSRHHFKHFNVSRHRSRPRRQGVGLFLSASYVLPGGEGSGAWGEWGEVSPCSRTCGGGVASQKRICLEVGSDGRPLCTGGDTKYFSCETQDCPEGAIDFRAEQCAEHNSESFRGIRYSWVPYTKGPNPCELNCMPRNERFYYTYKSKVTDGTRCNEESFDVCVNGICQPVGCDMMLGSSAREDKCRECRGNNTNCRTINGLIGPETELRKGYNDVLLIPQGATTIYIAEVRDSNNYLALRSKQNNVYYLNGEYHIDFPRSLTIAGALWHYERSQQGFAAPDKLRCRGPTTEPLYLSLLLQDENVGIEYEYSIPSSVAPPPNQQYNWVHDEFTPCSATCGGGFQTRKVTCRSREELEVVDDSLCDDGLKPPTNQSCNTQPCAARWVEGPWSACSKACGEGGTKSRTVHCEKIISNGLPSVVPDKECFELLGPKPELFQECKKGAACPTWHAGPWKACDKLCGEGKQTRQVVCHQKTDGRVEVFPEDQCADEKPPVEQTCMIHPCDGVDWVLSEWSGCDSCLSTVRTRWAECATKDRKVVNSSFCAYHPAPVLEEPCDRTKLPACEVQWYATQWSNCSVECGKGLQTRRVFCGLFDGSSVLKVDDNRCSNDSKYNESKPCEVPPEKCPAKWFTGPWGVCTKECGGGEQHRRTMCLNEGKEVNQCVEEDVPDTTQPCNVGPCDKDETLPVDSSSTPVMDEDYDYSEECDEEDYAEVGAEEEEEETGTTPDDLMFSDSPSTTEEGSGSTAFTDLESEFTESGETGSGSEPTIETDSTLESSGTGSTETYGTEETGSTVTEETGSTETDQTGSTESTLASESSSDEEPTDTTESSTTVESTDVSGSTDGSTTESSTDESTTELSTTESDSTTETSSEAETSDASTTLSSESESTTDGSTTETSTDETTESSSEGSSVSEGSTEENTGSTETSESGGSTESEGTTESGETTESGATTESGPTSESGSTETTESGATDETGSTSSDLSTSEENTTPWDWSSTVEVYTTRKSPRCKRKKKAAKCIKSEFGCCPDKRTPAAGPFDEGCPNPETCKESKFGCCPDEVSPATGPKQEGCPLAPCNETLYGCCKSDNKTAAQGNDQEGCPPPPPKCKSSKFGCCKDNKTEAQGPKKKGCPETIKKAKGCAGSKFGCCHDNKTEATGPNEEGCPCKSSEFGCCPDGVSPARGAQMEGCVMSCNTSAYGCCPDKETPAHGPEYEGCCAQYAFGCCPDNYKPAEGPHLEGCGCQYAHYGCCPDKVTIARGPNNEGCGCLYTEHGCCPDRHTPAQGPDFAGCSCHTYQFGCCPDGATVAKGPNLQGCNCDQSQYGCCGDGQTAAQGPERAGCDCSTSKYGCCPDGYTEAKGDKFFGCTDAPENRQAACSLATDRGPCRNYTVHWYYDMEYGGCSRFWYGGCEGNGNRFASKEECEDVCVQPAPKDACKLPKVKGACVGYHLRWYYDAARESCGQFVFGGCLGNANNFDSREICEERCEPAKSDDQCKLPIDRGSCAGNFNRWGFNPETHRCEQFIWGGCEGNGNRFGSEAACVLRCSPPGALQPECTEPQAKGNCTEKLATWSFSQTENRCVPFYYTGCNGNGNRFDSEDACTEACPSAYVQDLCTLPAITGDCADYRERWYYDTAKKRCRQFYYGGCGGNGNNFASEQECQGRCREQVVTTTVQPAEAEAFRQEFCFLETDPGQCNNPEPRWAYDASRGACAQFQYGGCGGNRNNFPSQEYCQYYCQPTQDICQLPMRSGPCQESLMRWFYDPVTDACSQFTYSGCEGNDNRFESLAECESRCRSGQPQQPVATTVGPTQPAPDVPPECRVSPTLEDCVGSAELVWYYEPYRRECVSHQNAASGRQCRRTAVFTSEEACQRGCGVFRDLEVCRYPVDPGPCRAAVPKVYFDEASRRCQPFSYGGCHGGPNRFSSVEECELVCLPDTDPCKLGADPGNCLAYLVKWYHDPARGCQEFVYGGCNGNGNRFDSRQECEARCRVAATTSVAPVVAPPQDEECRTPDSLSPCGDNATVWYYESTRGECLAAAIGGCRYANSYRSEEECQRQCGAFRGLDVCGSPLDPGPCRESVPKVYFNAALGRCEPFAYGGCHGGPNRFATQDECEEVCGGGGSDVGGNEVLPDCDRYNEECARIVCPYSVQRTRTAGGCERCSCVPVAVDCAPLTEECARLKCTYGMETTRGDDGCERCSCIDHPCATKQCPSGERCVATAYRDPETQEARYAADCGQVNKPGTCPEADQHPLESAQCRRECNDDADCRVAGKCCAAGCSQLCLEPTSPTSPRPRYTPAQPELPQAPQANTDTEPETTSAEGGVATLRCLFHGNPPPKITWRRGEITIDGDVDRYRLLSDGALEIVSLYRNDSGVYICVADNGLGTARQEVRLQVTDPVEGPAGISGEQRSTVTGELGHSLNVRCLAYGYPAPTIYWYRGHNGPMVPFSSSMYEARGNVLQIRALNEETLGEYECQAYNGRGKPASWVVVVQAYSPEGGPSPYLVARDDVVVVTPREPRTQATTTPSPEIDIPVYTVPVTTRIVADLTTIGQGSELSLPCEVDGYPVPDVYWTKDGQRLAPTERMQITESRLTLAGVTVSDSGEYGCHAANAFSSHSSTVQINVQGLFVPAHCTDNPFFANCHLIVRSKFCRHNYYSKFCCKSCVEAGQLNPAELTMQADEAYKK